jgi:hypothetical protein
MQGGFWNRSKTRKIKKLLKRYGLSKKFSASDFSSVEDFKRTLKRLKVEHERRKKERANKGDAEGEALNEEIMALVQQYGLMGFTHPAVSEPFRQVEMAMATLQQKIDYLNQTDEAGYGAMPAQVQTEIYEIRAMLQGLAGNKETQRLTNLTASMNEHDKTLKGNKTRHDEDLRSLKAELQRLMAEYAVCPDKTDAANVQAQYREMSTSNDMVFLKGGVESLRSHVHFCASPEAKRNQLLHYLADSLVKLELPPECKAFETSKYGYFGMNVKKEKEKLEKLQQAVRDGTVTDMKEVQSAVASATTTYGAILKYCRDVKDRGIRAILLNQLPSAYTAGMGLAGGLAVGGLVAAAPAIVTSSAFGAASAYAAGLATRAVDAAVMAKTNAALYGNQFAQGANYLRTGVLPEGYGPAKGSYAVPSVAFSYGNVQPQAGPEVQASGIIPGGSYAKP